MAITTTTTTTILSPLLSLFFFKTKKLLLLSYSSSSSLPSPRLLRVRRPPVGRGHPRPPLQQLLRAVVLVHDHLDEAQRVLPPLGLLQRRVELALGLAAHREQRVRVSPDGVAAVGVVHRLDQAHVVPVGDDVVGAVVDLDLDGVALRALFSKGEEEKERKK
jgi:hypothetical protein